MNLNVPFSVSRAVVCVVLCAGPSLHLFAASNAADQNWPQWRGPHQDGVAPDANPPITWDETNNVKWKVKIPGDGNATPIVWEKKIFVQTAVPTGKKVETATTSTNQSESTPRPGPGGDFGPPGAGRGGPPGGKGGGRGGRGMGGGKPTEIYQFTLLCLDRESGKMLWQQVAKEELPHEGYFQGEGSLASPSGITDGENVYAYFGSRGLYCYDMDGKQHWSKDLGKMKIKMSFGEGSSPAIYKDRLIINWDNEDGSFITALDKNTGQQIWKQPRDEGTSWSTPLVVEHGGKTEIVMTATSKIRSYDPETGKVIWECAGLTPNVIPSPVADAEKVYCTSGFQGNALLAIKLGGTGDITGSDWIAWKRSKSTPYVPSPLLYDGKIYFFAGNNGRLSCIDSKTGEPLLDAENLEEIPAVYASPLGAAGRVYLVGRNGTTVVLKNTGKLDKLAVNKLDDKIDASPIAAGKDLILRGRTILYCLSEK